MKNFKWSKKELKKEKNNIEIINNEEIDNDLINPCAIYHSAYSPLCPSPKSEDRNKLINTDIKKVFILIIMQLTLYWKL